MIKRAFHHVRVRYLLWGTASLLFCLVVMGKLSMLSMVVIQPSDDHKSGPSHIHADVKQLANEAHQLQNADSIVDQKNQTYDSDDQLDHNDHNTGHSEEQDDHDKQVQFSKTKTSCISMDEFEPVAYICKKGETGWTRGMMRELGDEFLAMYAKRPRNNPGGTQLNTQFAIWFAVKQVKPKHIIESGSWNGMGTWLLRKAAPDAQINVVDPRNPPYRDKRSNSRYFTGKNFKDFTQIDWVKHGVDPSQTLVFFDDHQAASKRILQARDRGFRHIMFDDNYFPHKPFDAFSAKENCDAAGCFKAAVGMKTDPVFFIDNFKRYRSKWPRSKVMELAKKVHNAMEIYYELPPLIGISKNDGKSKNGRPTWSKLDKMELRAPIYQFVEKPVLNITETAHILQTSKTAIPAGSCAGLNNNCCYIRLNVK